MAKKSRVRYHVFMCDDQWAASLGEIGDNKWYHYITLDTRDEAEYERNDLRDSGIKAKHIKVIASPQRPEDLLPILNRIER